MAVNQSSTGQDVQIDSVAPGVSIGVEVQPPDPLTRNFFIAYAKDSGSSIEMDVDGSGTSVDYTIDADPTSDIIITNLSVWMQDNKFKIDKFGEIAILSNGFLLVHEVDGSTNNTIIDNAQTTEEMIQHSLETPAFIGVGKDYNMSDSVKILSLKYSTEGIKLRAGTNDKIKATIQDNLTGLDSFRLIAKGYKQL